MPRGARMSAAKAWGHLLHCQYMTLKKRRRFVRGPQKKNVHLTERDYAILDYLYRQRFLRSDHLVSLLCPPGGYGSKRLIDRLRELFHAGFLGRPKVQLDYQRFGGKSTMVYALADQGAEALRVRKGLPRGSVNWQWKNRSVGRLFLAHELAVADFLVGIEVDCKSRNDVTFIPQREFTGTSPLSWRVDISGYDFGAEDVGLMPDAAFGLKQNGRPEKIASSYYFVEVDRGTMPVHSANPDRSSIYKKLMSYHESWKQGLHKKHFGVAGVRTLFLTTSAERRDHFIQAAKIITDEQPYPRKNGKHLLFSTQKEAIGGALHHAWNNARDDKQSRLLTT